MAAHAEHTRAPLVASSTASTGPASARVSETLTHALTHVDDTLTRSVQPEVLARAAETAEMVSGRPAMVTALHVPTEDGHKVSVAIKPGISRGPGFKVLAERSLTATILSPSGSSVTTDTDEDDIKRTLSTQPLDATLLKEVRKPTQVSGRGIGMRVGDMVFNGNAWVAADTKAEDDAMREFDAILDESASTGAGARAAQPSSTPGHAQHVHHAGTGRSAMAPPADDEEDWDMTPSSPAIHVHGVGNGALGRPAGTATPGKVATAPASKPALPLPPQADSDEDWDAPQPRKGPATASGSNLSLKADGTHVATPATSAARPLALPAADDEDEDWDAAPPAPAPNAAAAAAAAAAVRAAPSASSGKPGMRTITLEDMKRLSTVAQTAASGAVAPVRPDDEPVLTALQRAAEVVHGMSEKYATKPDAAAATKQAIEQPAQQTASGAKPSTSLLDDEDWDVDAQPLGPTMQPRDALGTPSSAPASGIGGAAHTSAAAITAPPLSAMQRSESTGSSSSVVIAPSVAGRLDDVISRLIAAGRGEEHELQARSVAPTAETPPPTIVPVDAAAHHEHDPKPLLHSPASSSTSSNRGIRPIRAGPDSQPAVAESAASSDAGMALLLSTASTSAEPSSTAATSTDVAPMPPQRALRHVSAPSGSGGARTGAPSTSPFSLSEEQRKAFFETERAHARFARPWLSLTGSVSWMSPLAVSGSPSSVVYTPGTHVHSLVSGSDAHPTPARTAARHAPSQSMPQWVDVTIDGSHDATPGSGGAHRLPSGSESTAPPRNRNAPVAARFDTTASPFGGSSPPTTQSTRGFALSSGTTVVALTGSASSAPAGIPHSKILDSSSSRRLPSRSPGRSQHAQARGPVGASQTALARAGASGRHTLAGLGLSSTTHAGNRSGPRTSGGASSGAGSGGRTTPSWNVQGHATGPFVYARPVRGTPAPPHVSGPVRAMPLPGLTASPDRGPDPLAGVLSNTAEQHPRSPSAGSVSAPDPVQAIAELSSAAAQHRLRASADAELSKAVAALRGRIALSAASGRGRATSAEGAALNISGLSASSGADGERIVI